MKTQMYLGVSLLALAWSGSAVAETPAVGREVEEVVVTGSRLVTNGNAAPTPVTVLTADKLLETAPKTIPEALNKLPQFADSAPSRNVTGANIGSSAGAYLNLRQFGVNRNLILLDGSRVPPTAATGAVDINVLPQALIKRVEVVTGGASAVYGSDAVTGVVNFILDKDFKGVKATAQAGMTKYGDDDNWKFNIVAGTDILGGRGHVVASFEHYDYQGVDRDGFERRPGIDRTPTIVGTGTAANPFRIIQDGRNINLVRGGLINFPTNVPALRDVFFPRNGAPATFVHGVSFGSTESGGDGSIRDASWLAAELRSTGAFLRLDYDLTDKIEAYVQGSYNESFSRNQFGNLFFFPGAAVFSGNPFIPTPIQGIMTANNVPAISVASTLSRHDYEQQEVRPTTKLRYIETGMKGSAFEDRIKWSLNYGYSRSSQAMLFTRNLNLLKLAAALDAVVDPATGRTVCQVSLTANASRFPGCQPLNPFGPSAFSQSVLDSVSEDTRYNLTHRLHDVNFAMTGSPFSLWAGPVQVSVNAEYRRMSLENVSNAPATLRPDCTLLRTSRNCTATTTAYLNGLPANIAGKQNVKEAGGEVLIPLLKDQPFVQSLELNLAGRYTDYSTSGVVYTWKVGGSWAVNSDLRLRATRSRDIRAPTLVDLFAPASTAFTPFNDVHTGLNAGVLTTTSGNPNLVPEIAKTFTAGLIYQPSWLPGFSVAVDYYDIHMTNAITAAGTGTAFQRECEDSNGTSPFCANFIRPLPFSDRSAANFPTAAFIRQLNAANQWTRGVDAEVNYQFDLADKGSLAIRALASYQPVLNTQAVSSIPPSRAAGVAGTPPETGAGIAGVSKLRVNLGLNYILGGLSVSATERWQSKQQPSDRSANVDLRDDIPAYAYTDVTISYRANIGGHDVSPFLTIENLFNKKPPITGYIANQPGLGFPTPTGFDTFGRFFTVGLRMKL